MVDCKKCKRGELLYRRDREGSAQTFAPAGLVRCDRKGRKYVSKDTKTECTHYDPKHK